MSRMHELVRDRPLAIDLDNPSEFELLMRYFNLKSVFGDVRIVKTKHGYHLITNHKTDMELRFIFGDCIGRLYHSELRGNDDVLFDVKGKVTKHGLKLFHTYDIDENNLLALPFYSKIPRGYYVRRWLKRRK